LSKLDRHIGGQYFPCRVTVSRVGLPVGLATLNLLLGKILAIAPVGSVQGLVGNQWEPFVPAPPEGQWQKPKNRCAPLFNLARMHYHVGFRRSPQSVCPTGAGRFCF